MKNFVHRKRLDLFHICTLNNLTYSGIHVLHLGQYICLVVIPGNSVIWSSLIRRWKAQRLFVEGTRIPREERITFHYTVNRKRGR